MYVELKRSFGDVTFFLMHDRKKMSKKLYNNHYINPKGKILCPEEPDWLQSVGLKILRHDLATEHTCTHAINPIQRVFRK